MTLTFQSTVIDNEQLARLVRSAQQGDRAAFEPLFQQFGRAVYATALRSLGDHTEAQELCQEVFCQAMRKIHQLRNPVCFGAWLRSIARRMAVNRVLRRRPEVSAEVGRFAADPLERDVELQLRQKLFRHRRIPDDFVVLPTVWLEAVRPTAPDRLWGVALIIPVVVEGI